MPKRKKVKMPNREEVILLLAGVDLQDPDRVRVWKKAKPSVANIAKELKCPATAVRRCMKYLDDPAGYDALRWGRGRPIKVLETTPE